MKAFLKIVVVLILVTSCKEDKKDEQKLEPIIEKESTSKKKDKRQNPEKVLTKADFESFFPKEIGDFNLINIAESQSQGIGTAT